MKPKISVFISYYNDEEYLRESIDSVLRQTFKDFELILYNHATTDSCREIAHSYTDERIKHIDAEKNLGYSTSLNFYRILEEVEGEYVKLFCADDILLDNALEILYETMQKNPEIDALFGRMISFKGNMEEQKETSQPLMSKAEIIEYLSQGITYFSCPTAFIKTEILLKTFVHPALTYLVDVQLWLSIALQNYNLVNIDAIICYYRQHEKQISATRSVYLTKQITDFEHLLYTELIFNTKNKEIIKIICKDSPYYSFIDLADDEILAFILAHRYLYFSKNKYDAILAFQKISHMMINKAYREKLDATFSYTLKDLNELYRSKDFMEWIDKKEKKSSLVSTILKRLNPFHYWKGHKVWKAKIRKFLGKEKKEYRANKIE